MCFICGPLFGRGRFTSQGQLMRQGLPGADSLALKLPPFPLPLTNFPWPSLTMFAWLVEFRCKILIPHPIIWISWEEICLIQFRLKPRLSGHKLCSLEWKQSWFLQATQHNLASLGSMERCDFPDPQWEHLEDQSSSDFSQAKQALCTQLKIREWCVLLVLWIKRFQG